MIQEKIHNQIVAHCDAVCAWFEEKSHGLQFPIYASFDLRDSGWKIAPVDANIFPAGFNNICQTDQENAPHIMGSYLSGHYPNLTGLALLTEEHTNNAYYWENVTTIQQILAKSGHDPQICLPRVLSEPITVRSMSGRELTIYGAEHRSGQTFVNGKKVDLIICNNDFSESYETWSEGLQTSMNPPRELGWYRRRKHSFFNQYNHLVTEFARIVKLDPSILQLRTEVFHSFDVDRRESLDELAVAVDKFLGKLKEDYRRQGLSAEPFCFLKNNAGTYGLAVIQVRSGAEILDWNNRSRKRMKAAKGGRSVDELIIQEGIPTILRSEDGGSAEPCIYMIGSNLVGGFLRTHSEKGPDESLNSPGAVYKKLCMSDLEIDLSGCPMENVYGWASKVGALAIALEARAAGIEFKGYRN